MNRSSTIADNLCQITLEQLYARHTKDINTPLICKKGSGMATYHRYKPTANCHQITYGVKMVYHKLSGYEQAMIWLTTKEIIKYRFYNGLITPLNLMSAVICHEFSHILQDVQHKRQYNSVHNTDYYRILLNIHKNYGQDVRHALAEISELSNKEMQPRPLPTYNKGDLISFQHKEHAINATILRINKHTYTVVENNDLDKQWLIPK